MASLEKRVEKLEAVQGGGPWCGCPVIFVDLDEPAPAGLDGDTCPTCGKPYQPGKVHVVHFVGIDDDGPGV